MYTPQSWPTKTAYQEFPFNIFSMRATTWAFKPLELSFFIRKPFLEMVKVGR